MSVFEQVWERRNTRSMKWDRLTAVYGLEDASDILPMWVADMDFAAPDVVIDAIKKRLEHPVFGYASEFDDCRDALRNWLGDRYGWNTENEWMQFHQGVVPAIATIIDTFTEEGDGILITTPVYPPFFRIPLQQQRTVVESEMKELDGHYSVDFEDFEAKLQDNVKVFLLCHPHNPGGIVWQEEDLQEILRLCAKYDVLVISDEIHADLVFPEYTHTPLGKIAGDEANRIITCVAPTKTFNLAGLQAAVTISPDPEIRKKLRDKAMARGQMEMNTFAGVAFKAAYEQGGPWLDELLKTLSSNMDYVIQELTAAIPGIKINKPHATYLLWIDYRDTGLSEKEMMDRLLTKGRVALEPGTKYGEAGRGFLRMNVAAPRSLIEEGVKRFIRAMED
ncbi:fis family transcriptional regulator [Bacillus sp. OxB-1]|uniref:MalY/PatB family protein n=1 Tax=Bacillus sp. (strain OxB-1) TaxID=98228 RepID=UPI000581EED1|nr:MalY/PatB family protein [Bacillus sp. OxB-1]BAQ08501.1 fis family transcriptional regulator [Bacillus sp. OxB-1]